MKLKLEDIQTKAKIKGVSSSGVSTVVSAEWYGSEAISELFCLSCWRTESF